jgi:hypothetical protein
MHKLEHNNRQGKFLVMNDYQEPTRPQGEPIVLLTFTASQLEDWARLLLTAVLQLYRLKQLSAKVIP